MSIAWDGTSGNSQYQAAATITWNDNISGNYLLVAVNYQDFGPGSLTVTAGGTSMTQLNNTSYNGNYIMALFELVSPPTGSSVAMSVSGVGFGGQASSIAFTGVGHSVSANLVKNNSTNNNAATVTGTSSSGDAAVVVFYAECGGSSSATFTGLDVGATSLLNADVGSGGYPILIASASGAATVNFSATSPAPSFAENFGAIAIDLAPSGNFATGAAAGKGVLKATPSGAKGGPAAFVGRGVLSVTVKPKLTANLSGRGVLSSTPVATGHFTGHGVLSASAVAKEFTLAAPLAGKGVFGGTTVAKIPVTVTLPGRGALSGSAFTGAFGGIVNKLNSGQSVNIQVLGDSTAEGYGDGQAGGWVTRLGQLLGRHYNVTVYEYSVSPGSGYTQTTVFTGGGSNTISMFNAGIIGSGFEGFGNDEYDIVNGGLLAVQFSYAAPDAVMIYNGYNDISNGTSITAPQWVADVETFLSGQGTGDGGVASGYLGLFHYFPNTPIIFCTQNTSWAVTNFNTAYYPYQSAVADALVGNNLPLTPPVQSSTNVSFPNVWVLDTQQVFTDARYTSATASLIMYEDPHPNAFGYELIASWMASVLTPTVVNWQLSNTLPGTGTLSATVQTSAVDRSASLHGVGVLSAKIAVKSPAGLAGRGVLVAAPVPKLPTVLSGHGVLSASVVPKVAVASAGHGVLSVTVVPSLKTALAGHGVLAAAVVPKLAVPLAGHGALAGAVVPKLAAALTGHGVLSATTQTGLNRSAALAGHGVLSATVVPELAAAPAGRGVLSAAGSPKLGAALAGHGVLAATAVPKLAATLAGHGVLSAATQAGLQRPANPAGHGVLAATASAVKFNLAVTLTSRSVLSAATESSFRPGNITGVGVLSAAARVFAVSVAAHLLGGGALSAKINPVGAFGSGVLSVLVTEPPTPGRVSAASVSAVPRVFSAPVRQRVAASGTSASRITRA
jgi:hypothetical protein